MVIVTILQFLQLAILARFLDPSDFGLMAILMVIIGFSQAFMDMGVSSAIIQRQNITHSQLSSLYWLNIFSGVVLAFIIIAISPILSNIYNEPKIKELLVLLSSIFIIVAIGNQYRILCQKKLQFNVMAKIDIISGIISFLVAIYLAYNNWGIHTLIFTMLSQALVSSILFLYIGLKYHHIPSFTYKQHELKGFYSFGLFQMGERSVNYISANIDKMLIGKMIGLQFTGFYNMAWQLVIFPLSKINPIVNKVAFPIYAKIQNDKEALNEYYNLSVKALSLITIPILAFLAFFSIDIVVIMFGEGWIQTATLVTILAFVGILKALGNPGGALILALGHANVGFWWNIFWALSVSITLYVTLIYFPTTEAVAFSLLGLSISVGMIWHILIAKIGQVNYGGIVLHFIKVTLVATIISFISYFSVSYLEIEKPILRVLLASIICLILYTPYLLIIEKPLINKLKRN